LLPTEYRVVTRGGIRGTTTYVTIGPRLGKAPRAQVEGIALGANVAQSCVVERGKSCYTTLSTFSNLPGRMHSSTGRTAPISTYPSLQQHLFPPGHRWLASLGMNLGCRMNAVMYIKVVEYDLVQSHVPLNSGRQVPEIALPSLQMSQNGSKYSSSLCY